MHYYAYTDKATASEVMKVGATSLEKIGTYNNRHRRSLANITARTMEENSERRESHVLTDRQALQRRNHDERRWARKGDIVGPFANDEERREAIGVMDKTIDNLLGELVLLVRRRKHLLNNMDDASALTRLSDPQTLYIALNSLHDVPNCCLASGVESNFDRKLMRHVLRLLQVNYEDKRRLQNKDVRLATVYRDDLAD